MNLIYSFPPRKISVPTDMGTASRSAFQYARFLDEQIQKTCSVKEISFHGNAAKTIAEASNDLKSDLLVMGAERKASKFGEFFSSTTTGVMQLAIGPLLVIPRGIE
jgi:nucleotide-binding universal stress UspA family protein